MSWLRRTTNFPSGISAGGGETQWDRTPQPTLITRRVTDQNLTIDGIIPQGTILLEAVVLPQPQFQPTAGTVSLDDVTNSVSYLSGVSASTYLKSPLASIGELTVDARFRVTAVGLSTDSAVNVGLLIIPRHWLTSDAR